jgi:energy-coupling factor transport system permease protein
MNPKLKLLVLVLTSSAMLVFTSFMFISVLAAAVIVLILAFGLREKFVPWVKPIAIVFVAVILINAFTFSGLSLTVQGFSFGLLYALRLFVLMAVVFLFVQTTTISRLGEAFDFLPRTITQVLVMALALIPQVTELTERILDAQRCRGLSFRSPNIFRTYFPVLVPLFAKTLDRSGHMALAMEARGFEGGQ